MNAQNRQNKQFLLSTQALPLQPKSVAFSALITGIPSPDIRKRKGSTDSHRSSSNRNPSSTTSQGRSNPDKTYKQTKSQQQNQQSATRSSNKGGNNMRPGMSNTKLPQSSVHGSGRGLRRPNSAAVLNKDPSQTNFKPMNTMLTSPTVALLSREPSQSFLPPKPYGPVRNSTFAKLPNALYQSVGSHPLANIASSGYISSTAFNSQQKRMPSASTERSKQRANIQSNRPTAVFEMNPDHYQGNHEVNTFSPLRRKQIDNFMTNPSSNQKSNTKGKSKQRQNQQQQHSSVKRKRSTHHAKVLESVQTLSPNIERIRPDRIIKEENKEEEDTQRDTKDKQNMYLDESEIVQIQEKDKNKENEGVDSQNSSLSFKLQTKKLFRAKTIKEAEIDIIKDFKQQLQSLNNQEQKLKVIEKKDKLIKDNEQTRKVQIDLMKQQMSKKLEGVHKMTLGRKKNINQQLVEQKEQDDLVKKRMEKKEQYQKEKEERQEIFEIFKENKISTIGSQSNSQTRKRELSKSQQRPMSAKVINHDFQAQQLTIKVPPVQTEVVMSNNQNAYDAVLTQSDNMSEIHALSEQIIDSNKMVNFQEVDQKRDENGQIINYIKKQNRERSKKRKTVENMEQYKEFKKQKALRMLQDQYKQNYEQFKVKQMQQIQQIKGKIKRKPRAKAHANHDEYYAQQSQLVTLGKKGRSKSKKRILDEEKENWQGSVSPGRGMSGTRSDKKNGRQKQMQSQEMMSTISMGSIQRLSKNVYELLGQKDLGGQQVRYQKSLTLANLHSQMGRENIGQQKQTLKSLQGFSSLSASKDDVSSNQEQSFNQHNQQYYSNQFKSQEFGIKTEEFKQLTEDQKNAFINEQKQQEMTPVIITKRKQNHPLAQTSNSQVVILGRPSDSIKSFDVISSQATPIQQKQIINNWMRQTQNKLEIIQKQQDLDQQADDQQALNQPKPRSPHNEDNRSSRNIKVRSSKKEQQDASEVEQMVSSPIKSPSKGGNQKQQRSNEKSKHLTKSSSKKKQKIKRNNGHIIGSLQAPQQIQNNQVTFALGEKKKSKDTQANNIHLQRPKSANIQKINMIELIQQQKKQQQEKKQQQKKNKAVQLIQRLARGYLDRKQIKLKREQLVYEQNFQMIKDKYFKTLKEQKDEQSVQIIASPIKQIIQEPIVVVQPQIKFKEEDQKLRSKIPQIQQQLNQSDNSQNKSNANQSQLSRSQASLKALIAQEEDKLKKRRPNSSDIVNKKKIQSAQQQKQVFQYEPEQDRELKNIQKIVTDRIDFQTKLNQQTEQQNKIIKGQFTSDSLSSLHNSNHLEDNKQNNESKKIKDNQQNNLLIKAQQNIRKVEGGVVPIQNIQNIQNIQKMGIVDLESLNSANRESSLDYKDEQYSIEKYSFDKNKKNQLNEERKDKVQIKKQDILSKQPNHFPGVKSRIMDEKSLVPKKSQEVSNNFFQKVSNGNIHLGLAHSQILSNSQQLNANTITSEDKDQSWQFDRRSFQDFFDQNSQVAQDINQVPKIESLQGSGTKQKMNLSRKLSQYEEMLEVLQKNHEKEKGQLKKLQLKSHLSPKSLKKKMQLERWVTKQEEQLNSQKKLFQQNVNEMITKIDKDLQQTKKRIGQKKMSNNVFNNSVEWSHDMSLGQVNSSSIHSTPRIPRPQSIKALNEISQTERNLKRPFEYKMPSKEEEKSGLDGRNQQSLNSAKSSEPIVVEGDQISYISEKKNALKLMQDDKDNVISINSMKDSMRDTRQTNIFDYNLAAEQYEDEDINQRDNGDKSGRKIHHQSSLSMSEPPQFQSPTLSVISPNMMNQHDFYNDEEVKQNQLFMDTFEPTTEGKYGDKELMVSTLSPEMMRPHDNSIKEETEPIKPQPFTNKFLQMENEELADAFLALKEPEQPFSFKEAQSMREDKELREMQADDLTNYIMLLLMEQAKHNMFPKRPLINGMRSPDKEEEPQELEREVQSALNLSAGEISSFSRMDRMDRMDRLDGEGSIKKESDMSLQNEKNSLKEKILSLKEEKRKKKLRGIKTTMRIVDTYLTEVFKKVKDSEDEFVENLSTPLNKDPLEILLHLQNVCLEQEFDNAVAFQQSVLPVDLYLDIERNKEKVQIIENPLSDGVEFEENDNKSMMAEWENIHNKVIFDAINEALDNFRPYGLRGPPMPWSQQTRTLTYKNGQQIDQVLKNVRQKVIEWARTFSGALPCSELLQEYGIRGPLDEDKLNLLREERLALVLASEIEENEILWTDYEYEETQAKLDIADMILEVLAEEAVQEINKIKESRQLLNTTESTTILNE